MWRARNLKRAFMYSSGTQSCASHMGRLGGNKKYKTSYLLPFLEAYQQRQNKQRERDKAHKLGGCVFVKMCDFYAITTREKVLVLVLENLEMKNKFREPGGLPPDYGRDFFL